MMGIVVVVQHETLLDGPHLAHNSVALFACRRRPQQTLSLSRPCPRYWQASRRKLGKKKQAARPVSTGVRSQMISAMKTRFEVMKPPSDSSDSGWSDED